MGNKPPARNKVIVEMLGHGATGFALGLAFSVTLIFVEPSKLALLIAQSSDPLATTTIVFGYLTLTITVGATLTGLVFTMMER